MTPYYTNKFVTLYHADCREMSVSPTVAMTLADPPYGETSLKWDRWPNGWLANVPSPVLWCFGSLRMFLRHAAEFATWKFAQDLVWEKQNGSGFHADRFKRVHEVLGQWYRGAWADVYKQPVTTPDAVRRQVRRKRRPPHMGHVDESAYESHDGGPRLMRSVIYARNCHGFALHPTQKPVDILLPVIQYSCPPGGRVYVPFAGAGSELEAAQVSCRVAIGCEIDEAMCEKAAVRLESIPT